MVDLVQQILMEHRQLAVKEINNCRWNLDISQYSQVKTVIAVNCGFKEVKMGAICVAYI